MKILFILVTNYGIIILVLIWEFGLYKVVFILLEIVVYIFRGEK